MYVNLAILHCEFDYNCKPWLIVLRLIFDQSWKKKKKNLLSFSADLYILVAGPQTQVFEF